MNNNVDRLLALIDEGLAAVPADTSPGYPPVGAEDATVCWRCTYRPAGVGPSGLCEACRTVLLDEEHSPLVEIELEWRFGPEPSRFLAAGMWSFDVQGGVLYPFPDSLGGMCW